MVAYRNIEDEYLLLELISLESSTGIENICWYTDNTASRVRAKTAPVATGTVSLHTPTA
jgi:hypothetical protein